MTTPSRASLVATWVAGLAVVLSGCSGADGDAAVTASGSTGPTFHRDVEPILQASCQSCHRAGGIAPFSLVTYDDAKTAAALIASTTAARTMPPWGEDDTDECAPQRGFEKDMRLDDATIALLAAWKDAGAPEGDGADAPPPATFDDTGLPRASLELAPAAPYVTAGDADEFRCFVLDPKLSATAYLDGSHVVPDNAKVVHHVLLFADAAGESAAKVGPDGSYDCFGGPGLANQVLIAGWVPGMAPRELPPDVSQALEPGTLIVMQIHYHPAGTTAEPDATRIQLRFADGPTRFRLLPKLIGNLEKALPGGLGLLPGPDDPATGPEFLIPAGATGHTETMRIQIPDKIAGQPLPPNTRIQAVTAHMHLVGVDEKVEITRADADHGPASECLFQVPRWDFAWQRQYAYDSPVEELPIVAPGDELTIRCTYDNTLDNPQLARALSEQKLAAPVDVALGESTLEEMCVAGLSFVFEP